ncbi:Uncharacterised protein [Chlamydia abortus]|nr:Uncharacterised protein [Chlamydia abortus]
MSPSKVTTVYFFSNKECNLTALSIVSQTKTLPNKKRFKTSYLFLVVTSSEATPKNPS